MGGSRKSSDASTKVTTKTSTTVRDVGLTGNAAVRLSDDLGRRSVASERLRADSLAKVTQLSGANFNQLVGGAGRLTDSSERTAARLIESGEHVADTGAAIVDTGAALVGEFLAATDRNAARTSAASEREFQAAQAARSGAERTLDRVQQGGETPDDRQRELFLIVGGVVAAAALSGVFSK